METAKEVWRPLVVCFICGSTFYTPVDLAGYQLPDKGAILRFISIECGRLDPLFILRAFQRGADAVLVAGCAKGDCHGPEGEMLAQRRHSIMKNLLCFMGMEEQRYQTIWQSRQEARRLPGTIAQMCDEVACLGPNRKFREGL